MSVSFEDIKNSDEINEYIQQSNNVLGNVGFTEHGFAHCTIVSRGSAEILQELGYDEHTIELARIAGYIHDIGNLVNRQDHAQSGAVMAFTALHNLNMPTKDIIEITTAIGHHDERTASPVTPITAALILADKSDVRRSRVRASAVIETDIHDRVNFAVQETDLVIDIEKKTIVLSISIDTKICPVMEYFEIFLGRMVICRTAAQVLSLTFELVINNTRLL